MSERIRIMSVIGRFLEHSRIFYFQNGADDPLAGSFFIGSADWMERNLSDRVEAVVPIEAPGLRERLWRILQIMLHDQRQAWDMKPDGSYVQRIPSPQPLSPAAGERGRGEGKASDSAAGPEMQGTHVTLMNLALRRIELEPSNASPALQPA